MWNAWRDGDEPVELLNLVRRLHPSDRKMRLVAAAFCRHAPDTATSERDKDAIALAERLADGLATDAERIDAFRGASPRSFFSAARELLNWSSFQAAYQTLRTLGIGLPIPGSHRVDQQVRVHWCGLVRDVFGDLVHPVPLDASWRTGNVVDLSRTIYEEHAFDRLPILADALMDAGCNDEVIVEHCRGCGPHVRGCWVIDLILGKT